MPSRLLIRDAVVIDGTGAGPRQGTVVADDDLITSVSAENEPSADGATVIEGRGKYVIPGLWETQAHTCESAGRHRPPWYSIPPDGPALIARNLQSYLRHGITTVVDLGGRTDVLVRARADQQSGAIVGARMLISGGHFNWPGGAYISPWMNRLVGNVADARREVDRAAEEERIDIAKIVYSHGMPSQHLDKMSPEVLRAIVEGAHAHGIPAAIHADSSGDVLDAIDAGVDSPEHMFFPAGDWRADRARIIEALLDANAYWPLTIILFEALSRARDVDWLHRRSGRVPDALLDEAEHHPASLWLTLPERDRADAEVRFEAALETAGEAHRAGVKMTISSDSGITGIFHGVSTIREMELHVEAGIPPLDVITMATKHAADKLRVGSRLGTVESGKLADLVVLDADPLESIGNVERIHAVIQGGRVLRPAELAVDQGPSTTSSA
jgi:imidazolonepropionase-like amidohydrolase